VSPVPAAQLQVRRAAIDGTLFTNRLVVIGSRVAMGNCHSAAGLREAEDTPREGSLAAGIPAHSCLRTAIGSTERARSAAAYVISAAPLATAAAVPPNVAASYGLTP
jgi:hypothetical protein